MWRCRLRQERLPAGGGDRPRKPAIDRLEYPTTGTRSSRSDFQHSLVDSVPGETRATRGHRFQNSDCLASRPPAVSVAARAPRALCKDGTSSYFSNQAPRTYAPKPRYAVTFWRRKELRAPHVDVLEIVQKRATRYYSEALPTVEYRVRCEDSRSLRSVGEACKGRRARLIITSPPYYGLRTYVADQWLRSWFLGGPDRVDYSYGVQLSHRSISGFVDDLRAVWRNVSAVSHRDARLIFRFGAINDRWSIRVR
jgi:hypothetical protein